MTCQRVQPTLAATRDESRFQRVKIFHGKQRCTRWSSFIFFLSFRSVFFAPCAINHLRFFRLTISRNCLYFTYCLFFPSFLLSIDIISLFYILYTILFYIFFYTFCLRFILCILCRFFLIIIKLR